MTVSEALRVAKEKLHAAGVPDADFDAEAILAHVTGQERPALVRERDGDFGASEERRFLELVERRASRVPLQHLTGSAWFYGRKFLACEGVLIPRFDTEVLVEEAKSALHPGSRLLDLCTGSGCVLITLMLECGCEGLGTDLSAAAIALAKKNAEQFGVSAEFAQGDLFAAAQGEFDVITANPPYIATDEIATLQPEVRDHDPHMALDGGPDALAFYRRIGREAPRHLAPDGWLFLEIGAGQGETVQAILKSESYREIRVVRDLAGLERVVCARRQ